MKKIVLLFLVIFSVSTFSQNLPETKLLTSFKDFEVRLSDSLLLYHGEKLISNTSIEEGVDLIINDKYSMYFLNDSCYSFTDQPILKYYEAHKFCSDNVIIKIEKASESYLIINNYRESRYCNGHAIMSIEFPGEDSIGSDGNVVYYSFQLGESSSYIYDKLRGLNLFEDNYFSYCLIEDLIFSHQFYKDNLQHGQTIPLDVFVVEEEMLKFCLSDTLELDYRGFYFAIESYTQFSNRIDSIRWLSKNVIAVKKGIEWSLYSYSSKLPYLLPKSVPLASVGSIITLNCFHDIFFTITNNEISVWQISKFSEISHFKTKKLVVRNYALDGIGHFQDTELLVVQYDESNYIYCYHPNSWISYLNYYKLQDINPLEKINPDHLKINPVPTEELILGH